MKSPVRKLKNIYHLLQSHFWRFVYRWPDRRLHIYGVTGTNGKTTTCHVLASILREARGVEQVGMLTTIALWIGPKHIVNETKMTTLPSRAVWSYLRRMVDVGVTDVVLEVTSHALDQHRVAGIQLDGAIILNLAREHLDYHETMETYAQAKGKIIHYLKADAPLVAKEDDEWVKRMVELGIRNQAVRGDQCKGFTSAAAQDVQTPLIGDVNKENVLAASLLAEAVGIPREAIQGGVAKMTHVPGRMEWVVLDHHEASLPRVLIDYAVTPDALKRLYAGIRHKDLRIKQGGRIFAVLGAAGLRDRGKRPDMARVVAQYADELVITREDPWTEPEEQIFADLEGGLIDVTIPWMRIVDRRAAIWHCLQKAQPNDIVVVTGKGAETGMAVGSTVIPWSDKNVIQELLLQRLTMND